MMKEEEGTIEGDKRKGIRKRKKSKRRKSRRKSILEVDDRRWATSDNNSQVCP